MTFNNREEVAKKINDIGVPTFIWGEYSLRYEDMPDEQTKELFRDIQKMINKFLDLLPEVDD